MEIAIPTMITTQVMQESDATPDNVDRDSNTNNFGRIGCGGMSDCQLSTGKFPEDWDDKVNTLDINVDYYASDQIDGDIYNEEVGIT